MLYAFVGSTNPVKVNAVATALNDIPKVEVTGFEVPSGVSAQPLSDEETRAGARNRAQAALQKGKDTVDVDQAAECVGIGLEGGVFTTADGELWSTVWIVLVTEQGHFFESNGARFKVPEVIADIIKAGGEMGPAVSQLTGIVDVKQLNGMIGIITKGYTDRTEEYAGIAKLAVGLWYGRTWDEQLKNNK